MSNFLTVSLYDFSGCQIGTVLALAFSWYLAEALNWESIFYIFGSLAVLWFFFWAALVFDSPQDHPRISLVRNKALNFKLFLFENLHFRRRKSISRRTFLLKMRANPSRVLRSKEFCPQFHSGHSWLPTWDRDGDSTHCSP